MIIGKITKITSLKKYFIIHINNEAFPIDSYYYECLLPYVNKDIDNKTYKEILAFSLASETLTKTYKKIFNHEISTYELKVKLSKKNIDEDSIDIIIKFLKNEGHLKEDDFIVRYIDIYQRSKGKKAFERFLRSKKISDNKVKFALDNYIESEDNALYIASKYLKSKVGSTAYLKLKVKYLLENKGYSFDIINKVISKLTYADETDSLIKEINKYRSKYQDDYKLYAKLLSKGYSSSLIKQHIKGVENYED